MMSGLQFTRPQFTGLLGLGTMPESHHKLQLKPKTVSEFKDALQLICLPCRKANDKALKEYRK